MLRCGLIIIYIDSESVPKIIIINTLNLLYKTAISTLVISNITVSECCLMKLFPYILFEKYTYILVLEMASQGNEHCANCIGTLSFPIDVCFHFCTQYQF